jgi:hypothetical protein
LASLCWAVAIAWDERTLYALNLGALVQAAIFGYVLTPVVMRVKTRETRFTQTALLTEVCVMLPTSLLVGLNIWFFAQADSVANHMLAK